MIAGFRAQLGLLFVSCLTNHLEAKDMHFIQNLSSSVSAKGVVGRLCSIVGT